MPESYFSLKQTDQREVLETVAGKIGRPAYLLEKDIFVVAALSALFQPKNDMALTFKGGTSLSKAYKIIHRFSEDIDLTCDIREFINEAKDGAVPSTPSQAKKWSDKIKKLLPTWISSRIKPAVHSAFEKEGVGIRLETTGKENEKLLIHYPTVTKGADYIRPTVLLEFGARSTGEPHKKMPVTCDMADHVGEITFPTSSPSVMLVERTFWEKATAAHVYCLQAGAPGDRFSRHWYDLVEISNTGHFTKAVEDRGLASAVAAHKEMFFKEKSASGAIIDYHEAVDGKIQLVPAGKALRDLESDYGKMTEAGLIEKPPTFKQVMSRCGEVESKINKAAK